MTGSHSLNHEFVEYIPKTLEDGVFYVSVVYAIAVHKCCCGCGNRVVTPFSPTDWKITFDGESITIYPSIGNWSFPCQSHYWIRRNTVEWAARWTSADIVEGRTRDKVAKERHYVGQHVETPVGETLPDRTKRSFWRKLFDRLLGD